MLKAATAGAFVALAAMQAQAAALPAKVADRFYVTLEEVRESSRQTFRAFAGPSGPPISRDEFVSTQLAPEIGPTGESGALLNRLFQLLDVDSDGQVTLVEWNRQIEKDLSFADANGDGRITLKELANARENMGLGEALGMLF